MEFPRTSQRAEELGRLVLGDKRLGKSLGFLAKQGNTLGTPGVGKIRLYFDFFWGSCLCERSQLVDLWLYSGVRKDHFLQFSLAVGTNLGLPTWCCVKTNLHGFKQHLTMTLRSCVQRGGFPLARNQTLTSQTERQWFLCHNTTPLCGFCC